MIDRVELKIMAKDQIKGNIGILFLCMLIVGAINAGASFVPLIGSVATLIISPAFTLSMCCIYLGLANGIVPEVGDVFNGFYDLWPAIKVNFLVGLFTALWSLLFVIPGIIKGISYSMSMYILAENKGMSALEAINRSKQMMEGHKMDYFVLGLSFIGWLLLISVTFGIAAIWVVPYISATLANFYNKIKNENHNFAEYTAFN